MASPALSRAPSSRLRRLYGAAASGWQAGIDRLGYAAAYRDLAAAARAASAPEAGEAILDAGCGTGALSAAWIAGAPPNGPLPRLHLLDMSAEMLGEAQRRLPGARTILGEVGDPHAVPGPYDRMFCAHVIEHCSDPRAALGWLHGRLRPGGQLALAVSKPHWCTARVRWRWGNRAYHPDDVREMLSAAGFAAVIAHPHEAGPPSRISCGYLALRPPA